MPESDSDGEEVQQNANGKRSIGDDEEGEDEPVRKFIRNENGNGRGRGRGRDFGDRGGRGFGDRGGRGFGDRGGRGFGDRGGRGFGRPSPSFDNNRNTTRFDDSD
ncbi:SRP40, C-terminal domain containing protein, putative [Trypanosoma equiperdum]|uniref:SRP40, C-terminal domain containing protein, putative n=1 Tax=Trypanosoma equiperdum TaxID=5694 RepID=A0A1G4ID91_TRYEQ|nr:SRP40, C-terminal domain containing protein, putative [Trypanosoma equiperdum]